MRAAAVIVGGIGVCLLCMAALPFAADIYIGLMYDYLHHLFPTLGRTELQSLVGLVFGVSVFAGLVFIRTLIPRRRGPT